MATVITDLKKHAGKLSDLAERCMVAVHEPKMQAHHGD
jgi:hypothetical protein